LKLAQERAARLERQREAGVVAESELIQAKLKVQERELELQQLMLRYKRSK